MIVYFGRSSFVSPEKQGTGPCSPVVCVFVWEGKTEIVFQDSMLSFQSSDGGYDGEGRLYFFSHPSTLTAAANTRNLVGLGQELDVSQSGSSQEPFTDAHWKQAMILKG